MTSLSTNANANTRKTASLVLPRGSRAEMTLVSEFEGIIDDACWKRSLLTCGSNLVDYLKHDVRLIDVQRLQVLVAKLFMKGIAEVLGVEAEP